MLHTKKNVLKFFLRFVLSGSSHQVKVLAEKNERESGGGNARRASVSGVNVLLLFSVEKGRRQGGGGDGRRTVFIVYTGQVRN